MKLVMTVAVRGAPELADSQIAYHLNVGVDHVVATESGDDEDVRAVLATYERDGYVTRVSGGRSSQGDADARGWMRDVAATRCAADWVIESEGNEFWWPRAESLRDVLTPVPARYTVVQALTREFARVDGDVFFAERMTMRDPRSLKRALRPVYRVRCGVVVGSVAALRVPLRAWYPIEVLRFPEELGAHSGDADLVLDERLRDALRILRQATSDRTYVLPGPTVPPLRLPTPSVVDDAMYAVECAEISEVDLASLDRHIGDLEARIAWLEQGVWPRILRRLSRSRARS